MKRIILTAAASLLLGVVATAYFLGAPRVRNMPGAPLKAPDRNADNSGTVAVAIEEKFFDSLLGTIFTKLGPPQLKLSQTRSGPVMQPASFTDACTSVLMLNAEGDNVKTGVRFTGGKIVAPIAFNGSYNILAKCVSFKGTGKSTVDLSFDQSKQTVYGRLNVDEITLDDVPPIVSTLVTAFVRRSIEPLRSSAGLATFAVAARASQRRDRQSQRQRCPFRSPGRLAETLSDLRLQRREEVQLRKLFTGLRCLTRLGRYFTRSGKWLSAGWRTVASLT